MASWSKRDIAPVFQMALLFALSLKYWQFDINSIIEHLLYHTTE